MKKALLFVICLSLLLSLGSVVTYANESENAKPWKVGETYFDTLKAAVATLSGSEATVYLCGDLTETLTIDNTYVLSDGASTLADGMKLTIEGLEKTGGGKYSMKTTTGAALIISYANLTIKNIDLEATGKLSDETAGYGTVVLGEGAYVTFDGCSIVCGDGTYTAFRTRNNTGVYAKADDVNLTLKNTTVTSIVGNGITNEGFIAITIEEGTQISSTLGNGVYSNLGGASITMNGGSVSGIGVTGTWKYGIYGGDSTRIVINGGSVTGSECAVHGKEMNVTINNGTFTAQNKSNYGCLNSNDADTVYTIVNGTFSGAKAACMIAGEVELAYPEGTTTLTVVASACEHKDTVAATCTSKATCKACGAEVGDLNPDNHAAELTWTVTADKHCQVYGCCGKVVVAEADHTWESDYTIDTEPTCTTEGTRSIHCSVCGAKKAGSEQTVNALGHTEGDWIVVKKATCTKEGLQKKTCTVCQTKLNEETVAKTAHTESEWIVDVEAQVGATGHRHTVCTQCDEILKNEEIPALEEEGGCKGSISAQTGLLLGALLILAAVTFSKKRTVKE